MELMRYFAEGTIDAKNRATVPTRYRSALEGRRLLIKEPLPGGRPCLKLTTEDEDLLAFHREYDRMEWNKREAFASDWNATVNPAEMDKNGRFVIPPELMAAAGISKESKVKYVGCLTYLEIWSVGVHSAYKVQAAQDVLERGEALPSSAPDPERLRQEFSGVAT
jgi:MraZ protein